MASGVHESSHSLHEPAGSRALAEISIVVATRDGRPTLDRAVRSALAGNSVQVVVVDDGSNPALQRHELPDDERVVLVTSHGRGASAARNLGAAHATAPALAFLDDDDILLPGWHDQVTAALADGAGIVCVGVRFVGTGDARSETYAPRPMGPLFGDVAGLFLAGTFALRSDVFRTAGGYDEVLRFSENTELSIRLTAESQRLGMHVAVVDSALVEVTRQDSSERRTGPLDRLEATEHILRRHGPLFTQHPAQRANWCRIAGTSAAQIGQWTRAARWFAAAARARPTAIGDWGRAIAAVTPGVRSLLWRPRSRRGVGRTPPG